MPNTIRKSLPINDSPGFDTECYHNIRSSIVLAHPQFTMWYYSHFTNLILNYTNSENFPIVRFEEHLDIYSEVLNEKEVAFSGDWIAEIRMLISLDEYVLIYFDWKNMMTSSFYGQEKSMLHECIIYGYDDAQQAFSVVAFEVNGRRYCKTRISYKECEKEFKRLLKEDIYPGRWFAYYGFPISSISIKEYPSKSFLNTQKVYFALDRAGVKAGDFGESSVFACGYTVNEVMSQYILGNITNNYLNKEDYQYWNIVNLKIIWNKKLMLERIKYLDLPKEDLIYVKAKSLFERSYTLAIMIYGLTIKYQKLGGIRYIERISDHYQKIYDAERRAVPMLKDILIRAKLNLYK